MFKRVVHLRLVGGLGNQLYQFSFAHQIFRRFQFDRILIDCSAMKKYPENWGYLLNIVLDEERLAHIVDFKISWVHQLRIARLGSFFPALSAPIGLISDGNVNYARFERRSNIWLDGYFERTLTVDSDALQLSYLLRSDLFLGLPDNLVVLNVRGGEFVRLRLSTDADIPIYRRFIGLIRETVSNPSFHVITDDIGYARKVVGQLDIDAVFHPPDPFSNFRMLYSARYKIISRSTFAEWACKLGPFSHNVYRV